MKPYTVVYYQQRENPRIKFAQYSVTGDTRKGNIVFGTTASEANVYHEEYWNKAEIHSEKLHHSHRLDKTDLTWRDVHVTETISDMHVGRISVYNRPTVNSMFSNRWKTPTPELLVGQISVKPKVEGGRGSAVTKDSTRITLPFFFLSFFISFFFCFFFFEIFGWANARLSERARRPWWIVYISTGNEPLYRDSYSLHRHM